MNCLCCGKMLPIESEDIGWHKACVKKFFGVSSFPAIEIDKDSLELLANKSTSKGYTVPGVQKKLSLHLHSDYKKPRLTLVNYPTGYILKPQVEEFKALPEAEQLVMCMADKAGIATVPHALVKGNGSYAYITKRIDRIFEKNMVNKVAMEDFCQLDMRLTEDKYRGSYERCGKIIDKYSSCKGLDMSELYMRLIFSYVVGNSDMHLKNFSLIEIEENSGEYKLSPAYDLLPVNVIMPEDKEELALSMNGKKRNLRKKDFIIFAETCGISRISAEKMMSAIASLEEEFIKMCRESLMPDSHKDRFEQLIISRVKVLKN